MAGLCWRQKASWRSIQKENWLIGSRGSWRCDKNIESPLHFISRSLSTQAQHLRCLSKARPHLDAYTSPAKTILGNVWRGRFHLKATYPVAVAPPGNSPTFMQAYVTSARHKLHSITNLETLASLLISAEFAYSFIELSLSQPWLSAYVVRHGIMLKPLNPWAWFHYHNLSILFWIHRVMNRLFLLEIHVSSWISQFDTGILTCSWRFQLAFISHHAMTRLFVLVLRGLQLSSLIFWAPPLCIVKGDNARRSP